MPWTKLSELVVNASNTAVPVIPTWCNCLWIEYNFSEETDDVPVPGSANILWETERWTGDDSTCGLKLRCRNPKRYDDRLVPVGS